ncbi:MAG: PilC/PilY family type IV pilus protein, partial [Methanosarcinaceae archaeon]
MLHINKNKTLKTMGKEAVRWQIMTVAFLSLLMGVFCLGIAFEAEAETLTVLNGGGTGTGAPDPGVGVHSYTWGDVVNLEANPVCSGFQWSGDVSPAVNTDTTITMNGDQSVTVTYTLLNYTLTLEKTGDGLVKTDDGNIIAPNSHLYECGQDISITASPDEGWVFDYWIGEVAEPLLPQTTVAINDDKTVTAVFVTNTFTLHMAISGEGTITTPSVGTHVYNEGDIVDLSAVPATDWAFDHWTGNVADPNNPSTTVTMNSDQTVTAFFITTVDPDVDHDGDGYTPNEGDCNDNDDTVHPDATEICGDGIDQDCDGLDTSCDVDNDGDGYLASIDPSDPSYDCDDNDRNINPGATEICGDGIDQDCDGSDLACTGSDLDLDGDGYSVNMGDCNDSDDEIHPGATEICGDGVDNDCYDGERTCQTYEVKCVDISDTPLDTQIPAAPANIMFVFDDSSSMEWEFVTTDGSHGTYMGYYYPFDDPGDNLYSSDRGVLPPPERNRWESQWSGYNKMYYDQTYTYTPWPNHSGEGSLPDADPDEPRSNPINASPTFDFDAEPYLTIYDDSGPHVTVTREAGTGHGDETVADAVRFVNVNSHAEYIFDNTEAGFENSGSWGTSSGLNGWDPSTSSFNSSCGHSLYTSGDGAVATWKAINLPNGVYRVFACWTISGTHDPNAQYRIYNGDGNMLAVVSVNQQLNEGLWNLLGVYAFNTAGAWNTQNIIRAHYYTWNDANSDGDVDNLEIYLVELDGGAINYYQFADSNGNDKVDHGELTLDPTPPDSIVPKDENGDDRTYAQERQNFANWYSFYRKREYTAKAAVGKVIDDMEGVQIGIKCINDDVVQTVLPVKVDQEGSLLDDSDTLLTLLYSINSGGGTILRRGLEAVGRYFDADDGETGGLGDTPYVSSAGGECQQAFAIVMTDGYYTGGDPLGTIDNADGDDNSDFDGGAYADTVSNTLADVAMYYYERDLSSSLDNLVPAGGGDTARHQHMVTYTISFGVFGTIDPADWPNCPNTCPDPWPDTETDQGKIDDMYHAAVNGRGAYLSAENPKALVDALKVLQEAIEEKIGSGASVSINSQQLSTDSFLFQGKYDANTWSGDIRAYELDPDTGELATTYKWSAHDQLELMDWDEDRKIITYNGTSGIPFRATDINDAGMLPLLDADSAKASAIVDFLRGDDSNEQDQGGTYSFRARGSKLGDIVHSSPVLEGSVLYVGSNNGMFHAFNVDTGDEIFAYVPRLVFESLNKLTVENPNYAHTYYIDQSPYIADVSGNSLLVGTLGKGGKGVYCLDVTDITNAEFNANSIVKWEFPANSTDPDNSSDADMGYGFSRAFIVDSKAGHVVIFSNGYDSTNERAVLFVLDPADGSLLARIDTGVGTPDPGDCNGLSTPALIDIDMDQKVDFAYAGDLLGNMWKFDLRD